MVGCVRWGVGEVADGRFGVRPTAGRTGGGARTGSDGVRGGGRESGAGENGLCRLSGRWFPERSPLCRGKKYMRPGL